MTYQLVISKNAAKELAKLDNLVKRKIKEAVYSKLIPDPVRNSRKLKDFQIEGVRRFRIGNYRIIFLINKNRIEILRIGHRREIYK